MSREGMICGNGLVEIRNGDCRDLLRQMPDQSVNCIVTSPPYFGLRDYGVDGQIGLEHTPAAFVAEMVAVFREARRVLRDDGVCFVNLGDSYAAAGGSGAGGNAARMGRTYQQRNHRTGSPPDGLKPKDLIGIPWRVAFALQQPWVDWQIKSEAMRGWVAGLVDGEGCITILRTKSSHSESLSFPPVVQVRMADREPLDRLVDVVGSTLGKPQHPPSQVAAKQRPSWQWKIVSDRAAKVIAEIYPFLTCKRKQAIVAWNHQMFRAARGNQARTAGDIEKEQFCKDLINNLNQRRAVDLPSWMVAPRVIEEPGWYLRQDVIWHKPNPMPESVKDRCTKAHEYIFMLTKSARYWWDQEAVKVRAAYPGDNRAERTDTRKALDPFCIDNGSRQRTGSPTSDFVNKRSVWTVATQPYSEAHFATYPPALIEPCILAGCPKGGTVLDPFGGAGTTGLVAARHGRRAILCELNPEYAKMARDRISREWAEPIRREADEPLGGLFA